MLDTRFPRLPGDVGNATAWPLRTQYKVAKDSRQAPIAAIQPPLLKSRLSGSPGLSRNSLTARSNCGMI